MIKEKILAIAVVGAVFVVALAAPAQPLDFSYSSQLVAQVSGSQAGGDASFTFSHNNGVLIVGMDKWTMSLVGGNRGDKLTIKAWKDGVPVNEGGFLRICAVGWRKTGCTQTGKPTNRDIGHWVEKVFLSGLDKGPTEIGQISFDVRAQVAAPTPQPTASGMSFTFSHNNGTMIAGQDRWTISVSGLIAGDVVWADAWKNGIPLASGSLRLCSVSGIVSPFHTSCTASGRPTDRDIGVWEESLFVKRRVGTGTTTQSIVIGGRGIIKVEVVRAETGGVTAPAPATKYYGCVNHQCTVLSQDDSRVHWFGPVGLSSCRVTCEDGSTFPPPTYSFAGPVGGSTTIPVGHSYTYTLSNAQPFDILYVRAWKDGRSQGKFTICKVESNNYQCTKSAPATIHDVGVWEGEVGYTRNGADSVLGSRGAVRFEVVQASQ